MGSPYRPSAEPTETITPGVLTAGSPRAFNGIHNEAHAGNLGLLNSHLQGLVLFHPHEGEPSLCLVFFMPCLPADWALPASSCFWTKLCITGNITDFGQATALLGDLGCGGFQAKLC